MKTKKGFTLVELLIAIIIIGILVALIIPIMSKIAEYSRVIEYLSSNDCVEIKYSLFDWEISLITEDEEIVLKLSYEYFLKLNEKLEGGEFGTWIRRSEKETEDSNAREYYRPRSQKQ